jgi:hypothetical protein
MLFILLLKEISNKDKKPVKTILILNRRTNKTYKRAIIMLNNSKPITKKFLKAHQKNVNKDNFL